MARGVIEPRKSVYRRHCLTQFITRAILRISISLKMSGPHSIGGRNRIAACRLRAKLISHIIYVMQAVVNRVERSEVACRIFEFDSFFGHPQQHSRHNCWRIDTRRQNIGRESVRRGLLSACFVWLTSQYGAGQKVRQNRGTAAGLTRVYRDRADGNE